MKRNIQNVTIDSLKYKHRAILKNYKEPTVITSINYFSSFCRVRYGNTNWCFFKQKFCEPAQMYVVNGAEVERKMHFPSRSLEANVRRTVILV